MRKVILFITLIVITDFSFASFPVLENTQIEVIDKASVTIEPAAREGTWIYAITSFLLSILGYTLIVVAFVAAYGGSSSSALIFIWIALASMIGAAVLGLLGMIKKEKGYWLSLLGFLLGLFGTMMIIGAARSEN